jgi:hypothetical protein
MVAAMVSCRKHLSASYGMVLPPMPKVHVVYLGRGSESEQIPSLKVAGLAGRAAVEKWLQENVVVQLMPGESFVESDFYHFAGAYFDCSAYVPSGASPRTG